MYSNRYSLAEVAGITGIPAEEIHERVRKGEFTGDGNMAMPSNHRAGFVNAETFALLEQEGRTRKGDSPAIPSAPRHLYQAIPLDQAAQELGITKKDLELLLVKGDLEGPVLNHRHTGVTHASLEAFRKRQRDMKVAEAVEAAMIAAPPDLTEEFARQGLKVNFLSLTALKQFVAGR